MEDLGVCFQVSQGFTVLGSGVERLSSGVWGLEVWFRGLFRPEVGFNSLEAFISRISAGMRIFMAGVAQGGEEKKTRPLR